MPITSGSFADVSKKISQLIAKSWLPEDREGKRIKKILLRGNSNRIKELFKENDIDLDELMAPIPVNVVIDTNTFNGSIEQIPNTDPDKTVTVKIPLPPRPADLSDKELTQWVNDCSDNTVHADNPYIRFSCS